MDKEIRKITLPDGSVTDNYSAEYMRYCEAKTIARWSLQQRRKWFNELKDETRINDLKKWLTLIWKDKN